MFYFQTIVALVLFANKALVLIDNKRVGWAFGVIGTVLATIYLYIIGLRVYSTLEVGLIVLMAYGFFAKSEKNIRTEKFINSIIFLSVVCSAYFTFSGVLTVGELFGSIGLLSGTYFLTHERKSLGWSLYFIAHVITCYICYTKNQNLFADMQIASAIISLVGAFNPAGKTK